MRIEDGLRLTHTQHTLHQVYVSRAYISCLTQMALATLAFFSKQVTFKSLVITDFSGGSNLERLFCATMRLHLWHDGNYFSDGKSRHYYLEKEILSAQPAYFTGRRPLFPFCCAHFAFYICQPPQFITQNSEFITHNYFMPLYRFRIHWEDDDQIYRDLEVQTSQTFADLNGAIVKAFEFDGKHPASFFESSERWQRGREISSEVASNKKDAPALSMAKTPVGALISIPDQKFLYEYRSAKRTWNFGMELIGIQKTEETGKIYPLLVRKEGIAPAQYGLKGVDPEKMMVTEEAYDLGAEEMQEGYGSDGDSDSDNTSEEPAGDDTNSGGEDY